MSDLPPVRSPTSKPPTFKPPPPLRRAKKAFHPKPAIPSRSRKSSVPTLPSRSYKNFPKSPKRIRPPPIVARKKKSLSTISSSELAGSAEHWPFSPTRSRLSSQTLPEGKQKLLELQSLQINSILELRQRTQKSKKLTSSLPDLRSPSSGVERKGPKPLHPPPPTPKTPLPSHTKPTPIPSPPPIPGSGRSSRLAFSPPSTRSMPPPLIPPRKISQPRSRVPLRMQSDTSPNTARSLPVQISTFRSSLGSIRPPPPPLRSPNSIDSKDTNRAVHEAQEQSSTSRASVYRGQVSSLGLPPRVPKSKIRHAPPPQNEWGWVSEVQTKLNKLNKMDPRKLGRVWFADEINIINHRISQVETIKTSLENYLRALKYKLHSTSLQPSLQSAKRENIQDYNREEKVEKEVRSTPKTDENKSEASTASYDRKSANYLLSPLDKVKRRSRSKPRRFRPIKNTKNFLNWAAGVFTSKKNKEKKTSPSKWPDRVRRKSSIVFKKTLDEIVKQEDTKMTVGVPAIVIQSLETLWSRGLMVEGIFRKSGSSDIISEVAKKLDSNKDVDWESLDIHVVAGLLKKFLRNLGVPLIPFHMYDSVIGFERKKMSSEALDYCIKYLPELHWRTFRLLLTLFKEIAKYHEVNLMTEKNLAIVIAPNILRREEETTQSFIMDMKHQHRVVAAMIRLYDPETSHQEYAKLREEGAKERRRRESGVR